jgi:ATP synthase protein I
VTKQDDTSAEAVDSQARRMKDARRDPGPSPLRGIGTFGMIGWSIVVPSVGGAFLGLWLDRIAPQGFSWTLALLLGGVVVGGFIAWSWVGREGDGK